MRTRSAVDRLETAVEEMREEILRLRTEVERLKGGTVTMEQKPIGTLAPDAPKTPRKRAVKKTAGE